jgi:hypothetical protein
MNNHTTLGHAIALAGRIGQNSTSQQSCVVVPAHAVREPGEGGHTRGGENVQVDLKPRIYIKVIPSPLDLENH